MTQIPTHAPLRSLCGRLAPLVLAALLLTPPASAAPEPTPVPPDVQAVMDKMARHEPLSASDMRIIEEWTMRRANDRVTNPGNAPKSDENPGMPDDVQRIFSKMRAGQKPTEQELARLKAWSAQVNAHRAEIQHDADQMRQRLEHAQPDGQRPRGRVDLHRGTVTVEITQTASGGDASSETHATVVYPVRYMIDDGTLGHDHALHVRFFGDTGSARDGRPSYTLRSNGHMTGHDPGDPPRCGAHQDSTTSQVEASGLVTDGKVMLLGEVVSQPGRPRPYLDLQLAVPAMGPFHIDCECGNSDKLSPPLLYPVTLDAVRGDVPFNKGTGNLPIGAPGSRPMDQAGDMKAVIEAATYDFDPQAFRSGLASGQPFRVKSKYGYKIQQSGLVSNVDVTFEFGPACDPELVLRADRYASWIPEGNVTHPGDDGNHLTVKAELRCKDGRPLPDELRATHIDLNLKDVSKLAGVASNWPVHAEDDGKEDLVLAASDTDHDLRVTDAKKQHAEIDGPRSSVSVDVVSRDFGAYGALEATADLPDQRHLQSRLEGSDPGPMKLPKRRDGSRIADAWWDHHGNGQGDGEDSDAHPEGNGFKGDGLVTFEEYRGFVVNFEHIRTEPADKDLFILSFVAGDADAGIQLFQKKTELTVHDKLKPVELGADRVINSNRGPVQHTDQHALRLELAPPGTNPDVDNIGTPIRVNVIEIPPRPAGPGRKLDEQIASVAHELLHACNVYHHGDGDRVPVQWIKDAGGGFGERAQEQNGHGHTDPVILKAEDGRILGHDDPLIAPLFDGSYSMDLYVHSQHGEHSGVEDCVMRYGTSINVNGAWFTLVMDANDPKVRWVYARPEKIGLGICDGKQGTGVNAHDHAPRPWHGAAQRGDCKHSFCVNDNCPQ